MNLIKYTNTTNPNAHIVGVSLLEDEQLSTFKTNIETIKAEVNENKLFLISVGEGYIVNNSKEQLEQSYEVLHVTDMDLAVLGGFGIDELGFAKHFVDAVIGLNDNNWIEVAENHV